jgi:hypothetical protein
MELEHERSPRQVLKLIGPTGFFAEREVGGGGRPVFLEVGVANHDEWPGRSVFRKLPEYGIELRYFPGIDAERCQTRENASSGFALRTYRDPDFDGDT